MRWWKIGLIGLGVLVAGGVGVIWYVQRPILEVLDETTLPQFIQHDFIDLDRVASISKFRSGSGHDYSYGSATDESCRSMKHYYTPPYDEATIALFSQDRTNYPAPDPATATPIYSPVNGRISSISEENTPIGKQFSIRASSHPEFNLRLFHVYPAEGIKTGVKVTAGQRIGSLTKGQGTDIGVEVFTPKGTQYFSYFQVMPDSVFAAYQARGITSRDELIVTQEYRDAHPYQCNGEQFTEQYQGDPSYPDIVYLSGHARPTRGNNGQ